MDKIHAYIIKAYGLIALLLGFWSLSQPIIILITKKEILSIGKIIPNIIIFVIFLYSGFGLFKRKKNAIYIFLIMMAFSLYKIFECISAYIYRISRVGFFYFDYDLLISIVLFLSAFVPVSAFIFLSNKSIRNKFK